MKIKLESQTKSQAEIETVLCKAVNAIQEQRSKRPFEPALQIPIQTANDLIDRILDNMIQEISEILEE